LDELEQIMKQLFLIVLAFALGPIGAHAQITVDGNLQTLVMQNFTGANTFARFTLQNYSGALASNDARTGPEPLTRPLNSASGATGNVDIKNAATDWVRYVSAANGNDANDGLSWGSAKLTIPAAYNSAPAPFAGQRLRINVGAGTYTLTGQQAPGAAIVAGPNETFITWFSNTGISTTPAFNLTLGQNRVNGCTFVQPSGTVQQLIYSPNLTPWTATTGFGANSFISPSQPNENGDFFLTSGGCTTGQTEPTWPVTTGATVTDGSCTWVNEGPLAGEITNNVFIGWGNGSSGAAVV
jgi:hypothetical protein